MKKVIMSVIGFAIALALVLAIWVPIANKGRTTATSTLTRSDSVDTSIDTLAAPVR